MTAQPQELEDEDLPDADTEGDDAPETQDEQPDQQPSAEDKARARGWRPKDEYKGAEDKWVDAEAYLVQTDSDFQSNKKAMYHLERELAKTQKGVAEVLSHQKRQIEMERKKAYEQAQRDLAARHRKQVEEGDVEGAERTTAARVELANKQVTEANAPAERLDGPSADDRDVLDDWMAQNSWFNEHPDLNTLATQKEAQLAKQGVPLAQRLAQTTAYIKQRHPQMFGGKKPQRDPAPNAPAGARRNGVVHSKPKPGSYEALSQAGRQACDRFVAYSGTDAKKAQAEWLQFATPDMFQ